MSAGQATRRLLLVAGGQAWGESWVRDQLSAIDPDEVLWIADQAPGGVVATSARHVGEHLGSEYRLLVVNAHQGLHPDAFAAAAGTLRGGGDCIVLAPPLDAWAKFPDPDSARFACYPRRPGEMRGLFIRRLLRLWLDDPATEVVTPGDARCLRLAGPASGPLRLTGAQQEAVTAIERVARGHARRPLVITADRGRGKSTALGIAAARLLASGLPRITVVAAHRASVSTLFRHAAAAAGIAAPHGSDLQIGGGILCFRPPARCIADDGETLGLVLVDEAAAIPVAVLGRLLHASNRLVFASTVHGYEGSGRGFDLRFSGLLQQTMPQWRRMRLSEPVRWAKDDPLEALLDRSLLLDAELDTITDEGPPVIEWTDPARLADDEPLLRSAFGLLVNAHYQTRPSDLRQLLDNPDVHLWLLRCGTAVAGVLLASAEGGLDEAMAAQVLSGARRPRGHLLPQSLAVHAGLDAVLGYRVLRVQRIAVHPQLQRRGLGRRMLQDVGAWAEERGFDLLGCAYGADRQLLAFWRAAGLAPVRMGVRVDPASAAHSLFMLKGLSDRGQALLEFGLQRFRAGLPWSLAGSLQTMDSCLAVGLLHGRDCSDLALSTADRHDLAQLVSGVREPATAEGLVWRCVVLLAAQGEASTDALAPLVAWQLQRWPVEQIRRSFSLASGRDIERCLRDMLSQHMMPLPSAG